MRTKRPPRVKGRKLHAAQRTLKLLRSQGYQADVAEKFVARVEGRDQAARFAGGYRKDLFGFIDVLAYNAEALLAVQTTSRMQLSAHLRQYRRDPETAALIRLWLAHPSRALHLHGWECVELPTKTGGTKAAWECTVRNVTLEDLQEDEPF